MNNAKVAGIGAIVTVVLLGALGVGYVMQGGTKSLHLFGSKKPSSQLTVPMVTSTPTSDRSQIESLVENVDSKLTNISASSDVNQIGQSLLNSGQITAMYQTSVNTLEQSWKSAVKNGVTSEQMTDFQVTGVSPVTGNPTMMLAQTNEVDVFNLKNGSTQKYAENTVWTVVRNGNGWAVEKSSTTSQKS